MSRPCLRHSVAKILSAILISSFVGASAHAESWVSIANQALPLQAASVLGPVEASQPLNIVVALKLRNAEQLQSFIAHVNTPGDPLYREFLTPAQFTSTFGPLPAQATAVMSYLAGAGFTNVKVEPNRLLVTASGTAAVAQQAFHTSLLNYQLNGKTVFAYAQPPMVPAALGGTVLAVLGLQDAVMMQRPDQQIGPPNPNMIAANFTPQDFWKAYDVAGTATADSTTIAIFAEGKLDGVIKDLRRAETKFQLPQVPVTIVPVGTGPGTDTAGADEFDMDTQVSTGMAGNVKELRVYDMGSLATDELALTFNKFVTENLAQAGSASLGLCESLSFAVGFAQTTDQILQQAAAQGQTVFASSGDAGASCPLPVVGGVNGTPAGTPGVEYPASSAFAIGVGGTTLFVNDDGSYDFETAWDAGGGGISLFEPAQSWQLPVLPVAPVASAAGRGRGVPDIAMDADILSPAAVIVGGSEQGIGGTSLSSPLALGVWARLQNAHGNALGFAAPSLYALASGPLAAAQGFNDVIAGSNFLYAATPGYDYTTGLGTFDITATDGILKAVNANIPAPASATAEGNACTMPGLTVDVDPSGDNLDAGVPGHDIRKITIAEPYSDAPLVNAGDSKIVIAMEVDDATALPPNTAYTVMFNLKDGVTHYVGYLTTTAPDGTPSPPDNPAQPPNDPAFFLGHEQVDATSGSTAFVTDGALDEQSFVDAANNRIVFVLSRSKLAGLNGSPLPSLGAVNGAVWVVGGALAFNSGTETSVDTTNPVDYKQVGNASCKGKSTGALGEGTDPVPGAGGSLPLTLILPLLLAGLGRRARRFE